ncbi:unnamed protein product [Soboliphyme baturini]|uniref:RRM domain-containing protein n=1 Tax=Soboliphyme baturini TaxID=241478 RepID=A0A183IB73_9BILA|nr:unnamed protein product [Soboliphyme baturini]
MSRYGKPNVSLYIRNVPDDARPDELRAMFNIRDAEDALYGLDRVRFHGRDLEVEFAQGDRKSRSLMRSLFGGQRSLRCSAPGEMRSKYGGPARSPYYYDRSPSPYRRKK